MDFMNLLHYLQILKMIYLSLYCLENLCKILMTRNSFEDLENIMDIWLLKYLMKLLGSKLYILNTFNFVSFWCGFALVLWCWWLPCLGDNKPSWRLTLWMTHVNPWVCGWGHCLYGQKTTCKRGIVRHVIPCCPWGEEVNYWVCGWG